MKDLRMGKLGRSRLRKCRTRPERFTRSGSASERRLWTPVDAPTTQPWFWCCLSIFSESFAAGWRFVGGATLIPGREVCSLLDRGLAIPGLVWSTDWAKRINIPPNGCTIQALDEGLARFVTQPTCFGDPLRVRYTKPSNANARTQNGGRHGD